MNILKQKFVGKNKVNFKKLWVKLFYLNFNEITSIEDLSCAYNNLIKTLNGENNSSEEIFSVKGNQLVILPIEDVVDYFPSDHITGTIAIPRKNNDIQFNLKILSQICKIKKNNLKIHGNEYAEVRKKVKFAVKSIKYPKLIKIFSPNVIPSFTHSSIFGGLISVIKF